MEISVHQVVHQADDSALSIQEVLQALQVLRQEVLLRWDQRTALSFRLQDLRAAIEDAGIAPESKLYGALHDATATAEAWMHPGTLTDAAQAHLARLKRELAELKAERAQAPATAIEARDEPWRRDEQHTETCLLLVSDKHVTGPVTLERIASWSDAECEAVEAYCLAIHVHASDNDHVHIPARPKCLGEAFRG